MRKVKLLIAGLLLILCFLFVITLFLPSKVTVSRSIEINTSVADVGREIKDFNNWKNWYPAFMDKEISISIAGSQNVSPINTATLRDKQGHEIMFHIVSNSMDSIIVELQPNNKKAIKYQFIISRHSAGYTQVVWNINTDLGWYPWERIQGILMDKVTGPGYAAALQNLKKVTENGTTQTQAK